MRILLIANYLPDSQQSMQRYAAMLQTGLASAGHDVRVIRPSVRAATLAPDGAATKWLGYVDKLLLFPRQLRDAIKWADVTHICDHSNAHYVKYLEGRPHVVTCHDLLAVRSAMGEFPQQRTRFSGRILQKMILKGLGTAKHIVCDSNATRADVLRIAGRRDSDVSVIYLALNYPYEPMTRDESGKRLERVAITIQRPFVLHVGGNQWYKNRLGVLKIFLIAREHVSARNLVLVMAGKPWTEEMRRFVAANDLERSVVELIDVADRNLQALYTRADVFLFPSLEEGFGWPITEAQSCGCPVVTSNRPPMTEVGGDSAFYIDPLNPQSAAAVLINAIGKRRAVREGCLKNASRFNSKSMIEAYVALYSRVARGHSPALLADQLS
jgi:glycosyltransferase involved in cell wall biosynthesis